MLISSKSKLKNIIYYGLLRIPEFLNFMQPHIDYLVYLNYLFYLPNYSNEYVQKDNIHEVMRPPTVRPSAATGSIWTGLPGKSF